MKSYLIRRWYVTSISTPQHSTFSWFPLYSKTTKSFGLRTTLHATRNKQDSKSNTDTPTVQNNHEWIQLSGPNYILQNKYRIECTTLVGFHKIFTTVDRAWYFFGCAAGGCSRRTLLLTRDLRWWMGTASGDVIYRILCAFGDLRGRDLFPSLVSKVSFRATYIFLHWVFYVTLSVTFVGWSPLWGLSEATRALLLRCVAGRCSDDGAEPQRSCGLALRMSAPQSILGTYSLPAEVERRKSIFQLLNYNFTQ